MWRKSFIRYLHSEFGQEAGERNYRTRLVKVIVIKRQYLNCTYIRVRTWIFISKCNTKVYNFGVIISAIWWTSPLEGLWLHHCYILMRNVDRRQICGSSLLLSCYLVNRFDNYYWVWIFMIKNGLKHHNSVLIHITIHSIIPIGNRWGR